MNTLKVNATTQKIQLAKLLESQNATPDFDLSDFSAISVEQLENIEADRLVNEANAANSIAAIKLLGLDPTLKNCVNDAAWDAVCYADLSSAEASQYAKSFI